MIFVVESVQFYTKYCDGSRNLWKYVWLFPCMANDSRLYCSSFYGFCSVVSFLSGFIGSWIQMYILKKIFFLQSQS